MQNFEETTKMRNKVQILGAFLLASLLIAPAGCSKENSGAEAQKSEPVEKTVEDHAAEARKLIESKREKAKADCGTYLTARAGSGRVRYTDEKGPDKKGEITVVGMLDVSGEKEQLSFKCTLMASDGPIYNLVNLELYRIEPTSAGVAK
jgi:hypothetical protein